ncbi:MAG: excinuclease ABC subunit UvrA [Planctomycetaceae bacterium]|nr:excinuclease ABC subunit UvrA [Planctomycetaceae bacterium]
MSIEGARVHNLQNLSVEVPLGRLVGLTGVSGSGKSTLAFDVLFAEGQRRYLESLSARTRQALSPLERPDVDRIEGLPATVCVDQRTGSVHPRSTIATLTEVSDFLRLLYARAGQAHCPQCGRPVSRQTPAQIVDRILAAGDRRKAMLLAPLVRDRKGEHVSVFEKIVRDGFVRARVDGELIDAATPPKLAKGKTHTIEVIVDRIVVKDGIRPRLTESVHAALRQGDGQCIVSLEENGGWSDLLFSERFACAECGVSYPNIEPRTFSFNSPHGACPACDGMGTVTTGEMTSVCAECGGSRLNAFARSVTVGGASLPQILGLSVEEAGRQLGGLCKDPATPQAAELAVMQRTIPDIVSRLEFLGEVGLGYLTLDRAAPSLSGGELQRARLASALGMDLSGVCYILDEPTAGLHPVDTARLIGAMERLRGQGNSVLVVEHDLDVIRRCDWVIDLGPGAGEDGGRLVAEGTPEDVSRNEASVTGRYLRAGVESSPHAPHEVKPSVQTAVNEREVVASSTQWLTLTGGRRHNLQNVTLRIPLERMVCITGVSGSGKSSLVLQTLVPAVRQVLNARERAPRVEPQPATETSPPSLSDFDALTGVESIARMVTVDQKPLGRNSRSTPATYTSVWDEVRRLFARTKEARLRGFTARRFRFTDAEGRCPACRGLGVQQIRLDFLAPIEVSCPACRGARFNRQTLTVRYAGKSVADVLALRIDEAASLFQNIPRLRQPLETLVDVGLGYLALGQSATTLSGGEAQRVKLAAELSRESHEPTLFVLDEPTTGLHPADVDRLTRVLRRLVERGHTVVVVEHHLGVIAASDWMIDLGPGAGAEGGRIVAEGTPAEVSRVAESATGAALMAFR